MIAKPTEKAFTGKLTQAEVGYVPLSPSIKNAACANCRWFMNDGCFIVDSYDPQPIIATGWCNRHEDDPVVEEADPVEELAEAIIELVPSMTYEMSKPPHKTFKQRLQDLLNDLRPRATPKAQQSFFIFKDQNGKPHWHAIYTNNFVDRMDEILTESAHDKFIGRLDMGLVPMPTLQAWHTPGSDHGVATCIWRDGHMVHAVGDFMDNDLAKEAIPYYEKNAWRLKMSHAFTTPSWAFDGTHYEDYNTIEITTLPPGAEANPYTTFEELLSMKERSPEKTKFLEDLFGKDNLAKIDASSEDINKGLEAARVTYKEFTDVTTPTTKPPVTTSDTEKGLAAAYTELVEQVNELVGHLNAAGKAIAFKDEQHKKEIAAVRSELATAKKQWDDETAAWQKAWDMLAAQVNLPIERSAHANATTITKDGTLKAQELDPGLNETGEAGFFGAKLKPAVVLGGA